MDDEIISRLKAGDADSVIIELIPLALRIARSKTRGARNRTQDAESVALLKLVSLLRSDVKLPETHPKGYILLSVKNAVINFLRSENHRSMLPMLLEPDVTDYNLSEEIESYRLTKIEAKILYLRLDSYSLSEISDLLSLPKTTVYRTLQRIRSKCRKESS